MKDPKRVDRWFEDGVCSPYERVLVEQLNGDGFPTQPLEIAEDGVFRFKENRIVSLFLKKAQQGEKFDLNDLAACQAGTFEAWELRQFHQLIGYSVSGNPSSTVLLDFAHDALHEEAKLIAGKEDE